LTYISPLIVWVYLHSNFSGGLRKTILFRKSTFRPFRIIQGFWYESKTRMRPPISPS